MKQISMIIEHRNFNLNVQDEYYDKIIHLFSQNGDIDLQSNNSLATVLSLCVSNAIDLIDIQDNAKIYINKIDKSDSIAYNNDNLEQGTD